MLNDLWFSFCKFFRTHLFEMCLIYISVIFSIFGNDIFKTLRKMTKKQNFFIRLAIFIAVSSFCIAGLTSFFARQLNKILSGLDDFIIMIVILLLFLSAGFIAEQKKQV